jgi:hypothetical protein
LLFNFCDVTYAKQDAAKHDDVAGVGNGFVDEFDTSGNFIRPFATRGLLNSPIGATIDPANFGQFSNDVLIGNFGDSHVNAFDPATGAFLGQLTDAQGNPPGPQRRLQGDRHQGPTTSLRQASSPPRLFGLTASWASVENERSRTGGEAKGTCSGRAARHFLLGPDAVEPGAAPCPQDRYCGATRAGVACDFFAVALFTSSSRTARLIGRPPRPSPRHRDESKNHFTAAGSASPIAGSKIGAWQQLWAEVEKLLQKSAVRP